MSFLCHYFHMVPFEWWHMSLIFGPSDHLKKKNVCRVSLGLTSYWHHLKLIKYCHTSSFVFCMLFWVQKKEGFLGHHFTTFSLLYISKKKTLDSSLLQHWLLDYLYIGLMLLIYHVFLILDHLDFPLFTHGLELRGRASSSDMDLVATTTKVLSMRSFSIVVWTAHPT